MKKLTINGSKGQYNDKNVSKTDVCTNSSSKMIKEWNPTSILSFDTGEIHDSEESPVAAKPGYDLKTPKVLKDKNANTFIKSFNSKGE